MAVMVNIDGSMIFSIFYRMLKYDIDHLLYRYSVDRMLLQNVLVMSRHMVSAIFSNSN